MDTKKAQQVAETAANVTAATVGGVLRAVIKILATILLIFLTTGLLVACIFAYYAKTNLSDTLDISLEDMTLNLASTIYYTDANGQKQELATLHGIENRVLVDYENIPIYMEQAAIAIEDKRFYEHQGVDWYRTFGAFVNMFATMKDDFGGSTITQQLIKNLTQQDDITVQRKLTEIFSALDFERLYEKDEIMGWYLNVVFFGQGCNGVGTASQMYFGKDVWDLSLAECASIIGITNNPSKYDPFISETNNKERQELILYEMYDQGFITYTQYEEAKAQKLVFSRSTNEEAPQEIFHFYTEAIIADVIADLMEEKGINYETAANLLYNGGFQIEACMNETYQNILDEIYANPANFPSTISSKGEHVQSSAILMDPYTGEILAMGGGIGEKTANLTFNYATDARRPPGSTFKPLAAYGPALDQNLITPTTLVNDSPSVVLKGRPDWLPKNAGSYMGVVTIQTALTNSLNTVSAQILDKLSVDQSYKYLTERLGFQLVEDDRNYAPLSLGQISYGVTVREMAQAYSAFANDGIFTEGRTYSIIRDSEGKVIIDNSPSTTVAFKANTAWTMTAMLNYAANYGTGAGSSLGNLMPHAGKTGSSNNWEDRWFVGYTPYYVCAVWMGYDTPVYFTSGTNPSIGIWRNIMLQVHQGLEYKTFKTPDLTSGPTNIFGDLSQVSPSPSDEESASPSVSPSASPSHSPGESQNPSTPPTPSAPVSPTPSPSPTPTPSPLPSFEPIE